MARSKTQIVERREAANAEKKVARKSKPALTARMSTGGKGPTKATIKSPKAGTHQKSGDKDANYEPKDRKSYKEMVQDAIAALPKRKGITMVSVGNCVGIFFSFSLLCMTCHSGRSYLADILLILIRIFSVLHCSTIS